MKIFLVIFLVAAFGCDQNKKVEDAPKPEAAEAKTEKAEATAKGETAKKEEPNDMPTSVAKKPAPFPDPIQKGERKVFGANFTIIEPPQKLAKLVKAGGSEHPVKVSAKIKSVCKKKGCWFTIGDEGIEDVRVRMKDYGFFVPKNCDGGDAVIEGVLTQREVPQDEAQHYADDAVKPGETPEKVTGPQKVFEFTATTVEISKV